MTCYAQEINGYVFDHWTVDGANWDRGINPITVTMEEPYEAVAHYLRAIPWWEALLRPEMLQVILGLIGIVLTFALVGTTWIRSRRRRGVMKAWLNEIDEVYSRFKMDPRKCEDALCRLKNTILEGLTGGKITEEDHDIMDKRIDKYMKELKEQERHKSVDE